MQIFPSINYGYSTYDPGSDIPDLQGKVILVTGANSGIGFKTAEVLASKGAKVYLGARDESRGKAATDAIRDSISGLPSAGSVHWLPLDLSTPQSTKAGADAFVRLESRLDVLIHNAGMQVKGYSTVSEGGLTFSKIMSANHLGSFVLTQELMPVLKRTAEEPNSDVRIVVVSSKAHIRVSGRPDFRNLEGWNALKDDGLVESGARYGSSLFGAHSGPSLKPPYATAISKLANVLFTRELQSRLDAEQVPITCISVHPGIVKTEGPRNAVKTGILAYLIKLFLATLGLTPLQGAYTTLFAATSSNIKAEPEKYRGSYVQPFNRLAEVSAYAQDKQLAEDLWACSEEVAEICLKEVAPKP
ncbi:hypothetical protein FRC00_002360 [Tulasnella sp. 408]|nr:hypothetical protein FRC00_002360 [Tulasnella sp. 408]